MTGDPEDVPPLARVVRPDVQQHGYLAYPLVDHVADKACAIFERHGAAGTPPTRYGDLVDLVAIVLAASVEAGPQLTALRTEAQRRGLQLPGRFTVPDRGLWQSGYPAHFSIRSWTGWRAAGGTRRTPVGPHNTCRGAAPSPSGHAVPAGLRGVVSCSSFAPMSARSVTLETFPTWVRGSASMSSRRSGHLYLARPSASR